MLTIGITFYILGAATAMLVNMAAPKIKISVLLGMGAVIGTLLLIKILMGPTGYEAYLH